MTENKNKLLFKFFKIFKFQRVKIIQITKNDLGSDILRNSVHKSQKGQGFVFKSFERLYIFRMKSEKGAEKRDKKEHRKKKKDKFLTMYRRMLGIQGNSEKEVNPLYMLKRAIERITLLEWSNDKKEEQILELLQEQDGDLQSQILEQQRELLALRSSAGTREELIRRQQSQIEEKNWIIKKLEQDKLDLKSQIWPSPWVEGTSLLEN